MIRYMWFMAGAMVGLFVVSAIYASPSWFALGGAGVIALMAIVGSLEVGGDS